jgi:hypothetical protein
MTEENNEHEKHLREDERWEGHEHDHERVEHEIITFIKKSMAESNINYDAMERLLDEHHPEWRTEHGVEPQARLVMEFLDRK